MLGWIKSLLSLAIGGLDDLWHKILSVITTIWSNLWGYVQDLYRSVVQIADDIRKLSDYISSWIARTYTTFTKWVSQQFNDVIKWADNAIKTVERDISSVISWASKELDNLGHYAESLVNNLKNWILNDVWKPLYNDVTGAVGWIAKEGAYTYDLITHPEKLTQLLIAYIWKAWLPLFKTYAKPLVSFIISQWRNSIPDIVSVIEDIISSLL
jgi:phage-related protein